MSALKDILEIFGVVVISYFLVLNTLYIAMAVIAAGSLTRYLRTRAYAAECEAFSSPLTPPISILLPAHNEEAGIVQSVESLLRLRYPEFEIIVVNDGSSDATLATLDRAFDLAPIRKALRGKIPCSEVHGAYASRRHPQLVVLDKANGGKADALNAAIGAARYPFICSVDADAILEKDALLRVAKPIIDDPELVIATGGIVRVANGCRSSAGEIEDVRLPRSRLATMQVIEYFRAFLVGRVGWSRLKLLLIISGAFGLFRRDAVEAVGGYWTDTVGEDVELVLRLQRHFRERGEDFRIEFVPDPVSWSEAPESLRGLARQRRRWQRGLAEALWRHRKVVGRPRYGTLGLVAMPYFLLFELIGPVLGLVGYLVIPLAAVLGLLSVGFLLAFLVAATCLGLLLSLAGLSLEEYSFRRYPHGRDVARMILYSVLENFGYRQLTDVWRVSALVELAIRRPRSWGEMRRTGLGHIAPHRGSG